MELNKTTARVIRENISLLNQGLQVLNMMDAKEYQTLQEGIAFFSPMGKHFRHLLNFYQIFFSDTGMRINYDLRIRDPKLETDRNYARTIIQDLVSQFEKILNGEKQPPTIQEVWVGHEGTPDEESWVPTNTARELKFIIEHTIHHYAIIAVHMRSAGYTLPKSFGVAPSTLEYEAS
jgi:uncharacterized damage-inducible protein DinB